MSFNCQAWQGDDYARTPGDGGAALNAPQRS